MMMMKLGLLFNTLKILYYTLIPKLIDFQKYNKLDKRNHEIQQVGMVRWVIILWQSFSSKDNFYLDLVSNLHRVLSKITQSINIPVPAPSSNETIPWKSDDVSILCNTKSAKTSSALQTCKPTLGIFDVVLCWMLTWKLSSDCLLRRQRTRSPLSSKLSVLVEVASSAVSSTSTFFSSN